MAVPAQTALQMYRADIRPINGEVSTIPMTTAAKISSPPSYSVSKPVFFSPVPLTCLAQLIALILKIQPSKIMGIDPKSNQSDQCISQEIKGPPPLGRSVEKNCITDASSPNPTPRRRSFSDSLCGTVKLTRRSSIKFPAKKPQQ